MKKLIFDIETTGLEPCKNRIVCISFSDIKSQMNTVDGMFMPDKKIFSLYGEDEKKTLEDFWNVVSDADCLIGFNSRDFDFQFILMRSFILGVKPNVNASDIKHIDLRETLYPFNKYMKGKLQEIAEAIKFPIKTENGMLMPGYYTAGNWDKIKEHCEEDVMITHKVYERCIELGLIGIFKGGNIKNGI